MPIVRRFSDGVAGTPVMNSIPSKLRVRLLGGFLLSREGQELPLPASRAARLLLAYVILHPRQWHPRGFLAGMFWPDLPEQAARRRLSQALWRVRTILPEVFESAREEIRLHPAAALWADVTTFQELVAQAQEAATEAERLALLEQAVALYRGPLLPGYYQDWVILAREQLHSHYLHALDALTQGWIQRGRYAQALEVARRLVQEEPLHEENHRQVIRLCAWLERWDVS
jgi:DNA-binding SARP family transcriptional activator